MVGAGEGSRAKADGWGRGYAEAMNESMAICVCTYNRGAAIVRTLEALDAMDRVGGRLARIVVVNNRSSDNTAEVVQRFIDEHPDTVIELMHEDKRGKVNAIRAFFKATNEPIVCIIDDDCLPDEGWARGMLGLMDEEPRAAAVGGPVENVWESGPTRIAKIYRRSLGDQLMGDERIRLDNPGSFLMGASMAYRREAVEATGWLDGCVLDCRRGEQIDCGEDAELCIRIRQAGWEVWYEPSAKMGHIIPARRQTIAYMAKLRESICRSEPWLKLLVEEKPTEEWARAQLGRARRRWVKTLLTDWRPTRKRIRLGERAGKKKGWEQVVGWLGEVG